MATAVLSAIGAKGELQQRRKDRATSLRNVLQRTVCVQPLRQATLIAVLRMEPGQAVSSPASRSHGRLRQWHTVAGKVRRQRKEGSCVPCSDARQPLLCHKPRELAITWMAYTRTAGKRRVSVKASLSLSLWSKISGAA